jgi:hypothetical protein
MPQLRGNETILGLNIFTILFIQRILSIMVHNNYLPIPVLYNELVIQRFSYISYTMIDSELLYWVQIY